MASAVASRELTPGSRYNRAYYDRLKAAGLKKARPDDCVSNKVSNLPKTYAF